MLSFGACYCVFPSGGGCGVQQGCCVVKRCPVSHEQGCIAWCVYTGRRSTVNCSGWVRCSCRPNAACCTQWNAQSTRYRDRAVGSWYFLLDVSQELYSFQMIICSQAKPSQAKVLTGGAETCAKRKLMSPCLLAIPAFDRIATFHVLLCVTIYTTVFAEKQVCPTKSSHSVTRKCKHLAAAQFGDLISIIK